MKFDYIFIIVQPTPAVAYTRRAKYPFAVVILQRTYGDTHFLGDFANSHISLRNSFKFSHKILLKILLMHIIIHYAA